MTYCYAHFKAGPPSRILAALGPAFLKALESSVSYMDFRETIVRLNDAPNGRFTKAARRYAEVCSPVPLKLADRVSASCSFFATGSPIMLEAIPRNPETDDSTPEQCRTMLTGPQCGDDHNAPPNKGTLPRLGALFPAFYQTARKGKSR